MNKKLENLIHHLSEQVNKGHFLNALMTANEIQAELIKVLNDILKGRYIDSNDK